MKTKRPAWSAGIAMNTQASTTAANMSTAAARWVT
jgi:hypothetical protein